MGVFIGAILIFFAFNLTVYCDILSECDGVKSQTFIADLNDCESYIYCDDEESFVSKCEDNQRFNAKLEICDDPDNVICPSEETSTPPQTTLKTSTVRSSTQKKPTTIITSTTESSTETVKSSSSTKSSSLSYSTTDAITSITPTMVCPTPSKPEEIIYLPNSESCSKYFMCFNNTPLSMICPKDLEFNTLTSSCDWASSSNCKIVGTTTKSPRELCTGKKSGYFEYANNCQYYYKCMNGLLTIQECPSGFGWDAEKKICSSTACRRRM